MNHLDRNLALLACRQPDLADLLRATPLRRVQLHLARNGMPIASYLRSATDAVPLHSRYDPLREARRTLQETAAAKSEYFILLGFGLGYGLEALLESTAGRDVHVFVIESDLEILRAGMEARDLHTCLSRPHLHFAWPVTGEALARQWQKFFDPVRAQESVYLTHAPSLSIDPALFKSAVEIIRARTHQIFVDINTMIYSSQAFLENFVANFVTASRAPGVRSFAGRFADVPCILVSAGPSLDRNIHELRSIENRALILAADTALKPLLAAGVEPHFVLSGDPRYENYLHLKDASTRDTLLVAEATTYPESFSLFAGRTLVATFENSTLSALGEILAPKGRLRAWGSVATMCLDFALLLGGRPILFVGQDLAFSEGRTYCSALHWEEKWFAGITHPQEWEERWASLLADQKIVMAQDLHGRPVASNVKLLSYWSWISAELEKHAEIPFINATEGGILQNHVQIASLKDALYRCCRRERDLKQRVRSIFLQACAEDEGINESTLADLEMEVRRLPGILARGFALCDQKDTALDPRDWAARCEQVKHEVYSLAKLAPMLDCFNQMGNISFLRKKDAQASRHASADEIRELYREYFHSLAQAAEPIRAALSRLRKP